MKLPILGKQYYLNYYSAFEVFEYFTLVKDSLDCEFAVAEGGTPYIDLTSTYFSHKRLDISDYLLSMSTLGDHASAWDRLHDIAYECRKVHAGSWCCTFFRLRDPIVQRARNELSRAIDLIRFHFPGVDKSVG